MANPIIIISGSEPPSIKRMLDDISLVDNTQIWPDYLITSKLGFTVGIARATTSDLVSNKTDIASHIARELSQINCDIKIFLLEGWMGKDHTGKISLAGGQSRNRNYVAVVNQMLAACIACNTLIIPSASITATAELLRHWNNSFFQRDEHRSLQIRPQKIDRIFSINTDNEDQVWWLADIPNLHIGYQRAKTMLKYGKSLMGLFIKTDKELQSIDGIGKKIANDFRHFLYNEIDIQD